MAAGPLVYQVSTGTTTTVGSVLGDDLSPPAAVTLTKTGGGTLVLTAANTYTGSTTITGGTLSLGDGGTTGSIASQNVVNNGTLNLNRSDNFTWTPELSGSGTFSQSGTGTVTLQLPSSPVSTVGSLNVASGGMVMASGSLTATGASVFGGAGGTGGNAVTGSPGSAGNNGSPAGLTVTGGTLNLQSVALGGQGGPGGGDGGISGAKGGRGGDGGVGTLNLQGG